MASETTMKTVNGSHHMKIPCYSLSKGIGAGKYIASDSFSVGGFEWAIYFYPDGKSPDDGAAYISLFIALAGEGTDVRALFELKLLDQSGKGQDKVHTHFGRSLQGGPYTLKSRGSMWGYKRYFKKSALETSDYLKDDCLLVNCTVGVVQPCTEEGSKIYTIPVPPSNMAQHIGQLLPSGKRTDIRAQPFGPMKDKSMTWIKIDDMEAPVFKATAQERAMDEKVNDIAATLPSMDKKKKAGGFSLLLVQEAFKYKVPVTSSTDKKKKNEESRFPMKLLSVQGVLWWSFLAAFAVAVAFGIAAVMVFANISIPCSQNSKFFQCHKLAPAQEAKVYFFWEGYVRFTLPQAVASTVGLLLPRRHAVGRWSLAFLAILSTTAAHYMKARMVAVFISANPGDMGFGILAGGGALVYLVVDLLCLLSLLVMGVAE